MSPDISPTFRRRIRPARRQASEVIALVATNQEAIQAPAAEHVDEATIIDLIPGRTASKRGTGRRIGTNETSPEQVVQPLAEKPQTLSEKLRAADFPSKGEYMRLLDERRERFRR